MISMSKFIRKTIDFVRSSLTRKLILSYLFIILIPVCIGGVYTLRSMQNNFRNDFLQVVDNQFAQLDADMTERINLCRQDATLIAQDSEIINLLQDHNLSDYLLVNTINSDLAPKLEGFVGNSQYIHTMRIIHGNSSLPDASDFLYYQSDFDNGRWAKLPPAIAGIGKMKYQMTYITPLDAEPVYREAGRNLMKVFAFYTPVYTIYMDKIIGVVETTMYQSTVFAPLQKAQPGTFDNIYVVHSGGAVLYKDKDTDLLPLSGIDALQNHEETVVDGRSVYVEKRYIPSIDSWMVACIAAEKLEPNSGYKATLVFALITGTVTLAFIAYLLSRILTGKLLKLSRVMDSVKGGDLGRRVALNSIDEVGRLSANFNGMLDEIHQLMQNLEKASRAEREAIYKALENQVNPHFLGNALEMIRMTAVLNDDREVAEAAEKLANYFLYNVKRTEPFVSLKDELKNVSDYLGIYSMMKNRSIKFNIAVSEELSGRLSDYNVLRFILQPVVENSIKHGFRDKRDGCYINIGLRMGDGCIIIEMEDNGSGMSRERAEGLREYLDAASDGKGFDTSGRGIGLRNINERLLLSYGEGFGVSVESAEGYGTKVTIRIPAVRA